MPNIVKYTTDTDVNNTQYIHPTFTT